MALLIGVKALWRDAHGPNSPFIQFLWAWFIGGLALLTLSLFKHKHYVIPILPPLSILVTGPMLVHIAWHGVHARRFYIITFTLLVIAFGYIGARVMPQRDHQRPTVEFVRAATAPIPEDERLYIAGLGQSAVYPYVAHSNVHYTDSLAEIDSILNDAGPAGILLMTLQKHLVASRADSWSFLQQGGEPVREKHPLEETLVLGRLTQRPQPPHSNQSAERSAQRVALNRRLPGIASRSARRVTAVASVKRRVVQAKRPPKQAVASRLDRGDRIRTCDLLHPMQTR